MSSPIGRIICLDYGKKRTGVAVTDSLQIIAVPLETVDTVKLLPFLINYVQKERVVLLIIGFPLNIDHTPTHATALVEQFIKLLNKKLPSLPVKKLDESFSSKNASKALVEMGAKKKSRQKKGNIDLIAATMLLQDYLLNRTEE
ncbi:MAG: Holliday junction resolvase RuvX [Phycisphaerales bacterium]|nr:Holliday junction resolvase RuvX [Phycisphaerales bacterium]